MLLTLQRFWADQGCYLGQPYDVEKGAGTMNPLTFFPCLGPAPWRVAFVEPCRRPADGRYGENPNRLYQHHQYQVILKPSPDDVQDVYLASLAELGISGRDHDIRFVEDNWESPSLGAWGLGWEVWVDGMEVTQFTYFQQMGGYDVRPVAVELTYGLERIALFIQNRTSVWDLEVAPGVGYADLFRRAEWEQSTYALELADVGRLRQQYDLAEAEARSALAAGLLLPAYDYVLKCSHYFNVLDARGALATRERTAYLLRVRELARQAATAYVAGLGTEAPAGV